MGTKNNPGKWDCVANAEPDEPMFVLLGRDPHAPILIALWAAIRERDDEDPEKVAEAIECAIECTKWCKKDLYVPTVEVMRKRFVRALEMYEGRIAKLGLDAGGEDR